MICRDFAALAAILCLLFISCRPSSEEDSPNRRLPEGDTSSLTVEVETILLPGVGESRQVVAHAFDGAGTEVQGEFEFTSDNPDVVSVDDAGLLTAQKLGSSTITVRQDELRATVLAYVATPKSGVVLISSENVVRGPFSIDGDPDSARYGTVLKEVDLTEGDRVLATDDTPIIGTVESTQGDDELSVVIELAPADAIFDELELHEEIALDDLDTAHVLEDVLQLYDVEKSGEDLVFTLKDDIVRQELGPAQGTVAVEPFGCETMLSSYPISMAAPPTMSVSTSLDFDLSYSQQTGVEKIAVKGQVTTRLDVKPQITAQVDGNLTCEFQLAEIPIPVGGPLAFLFGGAVPLGVGFELSGKLTASTLGFEAFAQTQADFELGVECDPDCAMLDSMESNSMADARFIPPDVGIGSQFRAEIGLFAYGFTALAFGPPLLSSLQFEPFGAKAGIKQSVNLATQWAQTEDAGYASDYKLDALAELATTRQLDQLLSLLNIVVPELKLTFDFPISQSPTGTWDMPTVVAPGESVNGTITLSEEGLTYLGAANVDAVVIREKVGDSLQDVTTLEATPGQTEFTWEYEPTPSDVGVHEFFVFVDTFLSHELLFEIEKESRKSVTVGKALILAHAYGQDQEADVFTIDPETLETTNLTDTLDTSALLPVWSANRSHIYFMSENRAWRMNADGSGVTSVSPDGVDIGGFAVSPEEQWLVYGTSEGAETTVWYVPIDGSAAPVQVPGATIVKTHAWSPDGSAFVAGTGNAYEGDLLRVTPDGSAPQPITSTRLSEPFVWKGPRILGTWYESPENPESFLFSVEADGSGYQVVSDTAWSSSPRWSRDGSKIAFLTGQNGETVVWIMNADGSGKVQLTDDTSEGISPVPSPDGSRVGYHHRTERTIHIVDVETQTAITVPGLTGGVSDW
jgi:hypothetical protein